jgi:2,5-diketo-D-gluconate reductase B
VSAVAKSASPERRRENLDVFDFELSTEERARIDALPKNRRYVHEAWAPQWD